jgi:hypothetical protein
VPALRRSEEGLEVDENIQKGEKWTGTIQKRSGGHAQTQDLVALNIQKETGAFKKKKWTETIQKRSGDTRKTQDLVALNIQKEEKWTGTIQKKVGTRANARSGCSVHLLCC